MSIVLLGSTSGSVTLQEPAVAGTTVFTLPAASGNVMVSGNMPAFSASRTGADQSVTTATWTKAQFNNEIFDTASCYDPTTNYRFTPNVAGYYLFMMNPLVGVTGSFTDLYIQFYINGAGNNQYTYMIPSGSSVSPTLQTIIYMNGTTDFVEAYIRITGTSPVHFSGGGVFNGVLVRTA
jgi:hypothetical protein